MSTSELKEFKRWIAPNAAQIFTTAPKNKKTPTNPLSRETSPHTNQTFAEPSPSRETGPHPTKSPKKLAQALKKRAKYDAKQKTHTASPDHSRKALVKAVKRTVKTSHPDKSMKTLATALRQNVEQKDERPIRSYAERIRELIGPPEQCKECGGEHPTRICIHRSKRLREEQERTTRPKTMTTTSGTMKQQHALPKTVRFDAAIEEISDTQPPTSPTSELVEKLEGLHIPSDDEADDENSGSDTLCDSEESSDAGSVETQQPSSQNDEANARLAHAGWLRKASDNVYMSNRKSMVLKAYIHAAHRRTEAPTLLDSGATENFINLNYAKWLKLPFKRLPYERPLFNVDGSTNKTGMLQ